MLTSTAMSAPTQRQQAALGLERLAALVRAQSWRSDGAPPLPPTQATVLRMLAASGEGLRAGHIAVQLGVSAASLSDSVKVLVERKWVRRSADPDDGRASLLRLTAAGRRVAQALSRPGQGMDRLLAALPEADVGALLRLTQLLVRAAQDQGLASGLRTCLGCRFFRPYASGDRQKPHMCALVGQPFGDPDLRVDCPEHEPAPAGRASDDARRLAASIPSPETTADG
jgi:DNA-binding MarR family transcriptional regulator